MFFPIPKRKVREDDQQTVGPTANKHPLCILYIFALSEQLRVFRSHSIPPYHKPFNAIRSLLVNPKDKFKKEKQCGVVYSVRCSGCNKEYIGETARILSTRFREHTDCKNLNSAITEHTSTTSHCYPMDDTKILVREDMWFPRKIREALHIHKRPPALNRDPNHEIPPILLQLLGHVTSHSNHR